MKFNLCKECPEQEFCEVKCNAFYEEANLDTSDCYTNTEYVSKGVPLLSYAESRKTKEQVNE